jgi:hypothetical protein
MRSGRIVAAFAIIAVLSSLPAFAADTWTGPGWYLIDDGTESDGYGGASIELGPFPSADQCQAAIKQRPNPNYGGYHCLYLNSAAQLDQLYPSE